MQDAQDAASPREMQVDTKETLDGIDSQAPSVEQQVQEDRKPELEQLPAKSVSCI